MPLTGRRNDTTQAVSALTPSQFVPPSVIFYYEMYLRNVNASLTSLAEVKGFRSFVKAEADRIGVTGFIQRFHVNDLKLGFEGSEQQCDDFMDWLHRLRSDYHMIEWFESIFAARQRRIRYLDSFQKLMDHLILRDAIYRDGYSEGEHGQDD